MRALTQPPWRHIGVTASREVLLGMKNLLCGGEAAVYSVACLEVAMREKGTTSVRHGHVARGDRSLKSLLQKRLEAISAVGEIP